ncbi:MAG: helix-hairpin-helix domain-containing protein [Myxococcota bacterium]
MSPSVASGALALSAGLVVVAACFTIAAGWPSNPAEGPRCCESPVEIGSGRIGCIGSVELDRCGALTVGDRVELTESGCSVHSGGMSAGLRLLLGLGLPVNRASQADFELLDGVGPALAGAIVEERERGGAFLSFSDLERVRGIGPAMRAKLEPFLTLDAGDDTERQ